MKVVYRWLKKGIYESHCALAELRLIEELAVFVGIMAGFMMALSLVIEMVRIPPLHIATLPSC